MVIFLCFRLAWTFSGNSTVSVDHKFGRCLPISIKLTPFYKYLTENSRTTAYKQYHSTDDIMPFEKCAIKKRRMTSQEFNFLEFMGLVNIFRKKRMKNARFPKTSLLVQIGEEI